MSIIPNDPKRDHIVGIVQLPRDITAEVRVEWIRHDDAERWTVVLLLAGVETDAVGAAAVMTRDQAARIAGLLLAANAKASRLAPYPGGPLQ